MAPAVLRIFCGRVMLAGVLLNPVEAIDWAVQRPIQNLRRPALEPIMQGLTDIGKPQYVFAVLLGVACFGGAAGPAVARRALMVLLPTNLVVELTKRVVNRTRPDGEHKRSNASFPSSHAANAAALAWVFASRWPRGAVIFWVLAAAVGLTRIYLNRHFLSDVLFGVALGVGISWLVTRWLDSRGFGRIPGRGRKRKGYA